VRARVQVKEEYDSLRTEFFAGLQDVVYCDLPTSRAKAFKVRSPGARCAAPTRRALQICALRLCTSPLRNASATPRTLPSPAPECRSRGGAELQCEMRSAPHLAVCACRSTGRTRPTSQSRPRHSA
jgi:hypothetical protein